jgi:quercetin dioxygenase-like cupin family protein
MGVDKDGRLKQETFPDMIKQLPEAYSSVSDIQKGWILPGQNCQVVFWETRCKGGYHFKKHSHTFGEYAVVLEGAGYRIVNGKRIEVHVGDENYTPPGVEHEVYITSDVWRAIDFFGNPDWVKTKASVEKGKS